VDNEHGDVYTSKAAERFKFFHVTVKNIFQQNNSFRIVLL